jgi:hypothetical protein
LTRGHGACIAKFERAGRWCARSASLAARAPNLCCPAGRHLTNGVAKAAPHGSGRLQIPTSN